MPYKRLSDRYTHEDLGITRAEFNRLLKAIDDGILPARVAFDKRNIDSFRYGSMHVDELIRNWSRARGEYIDPFADREIVLNQHEFKEIIHEAALQTPNFKEYEIDGMTVYVSFYSDSGKSIWEAIYDFNDNGKITGKFNCQVSYLSAKAPRWFGDNVTNLIRRLTDEKDSY